MPDDRAATTEPPRPRRDPPPTNRQIYALARAVLDDAGIAFPATRSEASALIAHLRGEDREKR